MSVLFVPNEGYQVDSAVVSAPPLTMACWFRSASITAAQWVMMLSHLTNNNSFHGIRISGDIAGDPIQASSRTVSGSARVANSTTGYSANTWHHACATFTAAGSDRTIYLDGGSSATNTQNANPALNETSIGLAEGNFGRVEYFDGRIAEAAIWNVVLNANEVAALASGISPLLIRALNLVAYWPLYSTALNHDFAGANSFGTTIGTPADANHAPVAPFRIAHRSRMPEIEVAAVPGQETDVAIMIRGFVAKPHGRLMQAPMRIGDLFEPPAAGQATDTAVVIRGFATKEHARQRQTPQRAGDLFEPPAAGQDTDAAIRVRGIVSKAHARRRPVPPPADEVAVPPEPGQDVDLALRIRGFVAKLHGRLMQAPQRIGDLFQEAAPGQEVDNALRVRGVVSKTHGRQQHARQREGDLREPPALGQDQPVPGALKTFASKVRLWAPAWFSALRIDAAVVPVVAALQRWRKIGLRLFKGL